MVSDIFLFSPRSLGKWSNLTNIFQMGWKHQLVDDSLRREPPLCLSGHLGRCKKHTQHGCDCLTVGNLPAISSKSFGWWKYDQMKRQQSVVRWSRWFFCAVFFWTKSLNQFFKGVTLIILCRNLRKLPGLWIWRLKTPIFHYTLESMDMNLRFKQVIFWKGRLIVPWLSLQILNIAC